MSEPLIRDAWCGEELYGHTQGWCYCVEIAALRQQLAQKEHALCTMREVNDYDTTYQLELEAQLATTTAHLEAQRTATYQAVAREHAAKREVAELKQETPCVHPHCHLIIEKTATS